MTSILNSNNTVMLATAMAAVSGTVIVLALRLQKSLPATAQFPANRPIPLSLPIRSCISSDEKRRDKKKKRVHFAEDVVDPTGNSEEFRKKLHRNSKPEAATPRSNKVRVGEMPANRMALYNGILRDRVVHRPAYFCSY